MQRKTMEKKALVSSPVLFNEDGHTYTLDGHTLQGVTPIIAWLFPETYKGIPQSILNQAAEYGTLIHKKCELADSMGIVDDPIVADYMEVMQQHGLKVMLSEYLVSDEENIASCIDKVTENNDLCDIKTTSKVHIPNVTMQLSIYAWLFELQNPGQKVGELYCIWLPKPQYGQADIIWLKRVPSEICAEIVQIYLNSPDDLLNARAILAQTDFEFEHQRKTGDVPEVFADLMDELITISETKKQLEEREKVIKDIVLSEMQKDNMDKWGNDLIQFTRKAAYNRVSIDSKALKELHPDIYTECSKTTTYSESLTYKVL